MKFLHLADLHLGKRINEYSLFEDQKYILESIVSIAESEKVDSVIIAGDIYDKSVPAAKAVSLFDKFITRLKTLGIRLFIISGNHDSAERLEFGSEIMKNSDIFISSVFREIPKPITVSDSFGEIDVYLLPFVKAVNVRHVVEGSEVETTDQAIREVISLMKPDSNRRSVLVAHQFVAGASRCDSEDIFAGGSDSIGADAFSGFDYVALGHLHGPQKIVSENIRYSGSPLKYSASESSHKKSIPIVEIMEKGHLEIKLIPLTPIRDLRKIRGSYEELTLRKNYEATNTQDYVCITLTDENDIPNAIGKLRSIYPNILSLEYDNKRTALLKALSPIEAEEAKNPFELVSDFYKLRNNAEMSDFQAEEVRSIIESLES